MVLSMLTSQLNNKKMPLPPDLSKPAFAIFPEAADRIMQSLCVTCSNEIHDTDFRDTVSKKEYGISGLCQTCQDSVFGSDPEEEPDWDSVEEMFN